MKIVIAPDSFKESLSADKCCQAIKAGFSTVFPDARYVCLPIADGGEGTVDAMVAATGGKRVSVDVSGPMGEKVNGFYGLTGDGKTAIIEMAAASGLMLVAPEARNPLLASSFGTGELIRHALDAGIRHIILGIGGSATVDGGMGVAQVLGVRFLDAQGTPLGAGGGNLSRLASIDLQGCDPRISECRIEVACDVDNPLVGPRGAAAVFGPQKGATPEMVETLENGLRNYARVLHALTGRDMSQIPGGGAAGGMGIAGEGRIDSQTAGGKAPIGVASVAKRHHVPVIGIAGVLGDGVEVVHRHGIDAVFSILPRLAPLPEVLANGEQNLYHSACNIARVIKLGQDIGTH
ncbi:TPA: glycerate kinase [Salmonella enterica subsp. enterica]